MKATKLKELIQIDVKLAKPVYKQIVESILNNIDKKIMVKNDMIPSVNRIASEFSLARGSVFAAYNELRASGIIESIPGKGYYISSTEIKQKQNIFLLFSTFTPYKEILYNAILNNLPKTSSIDIYFHHHNIMIFEKLINEQAGSYNRFIIMPELHTDTLGILSKLDSNHTFLLDVGFKEYGKHFSGVYQNFEKDIYSILLKMLHLFEKYKRVFLVVPDELITGGIIAGFKRFSKRNIIRTEICSSISPSDIQKHDSFLVVDDNILVDIINVAKVKKWQIGKDIGIISYNESNLKSVIGNGITTITTDFIAMGKAIAEMVVAGEGEVIENSFLLIDRKSF